MPRIFYAICYFSFLPFLLLKYYFRSLKNVEYRRHLLERLSFKLPDFQPQNPVHIHLVSVGEANAAQTLIENIAVKFSDVPILITVTTPTGRARVQKLFGHLNQVQICYLPFDIALLMERFLRFVQPRLSIILETELWPYFLLYAKRKKIPVVLINARLSKKSLKGYLKLSRTAKEMVTTLDRILAQYPSDKKRLIRLGCEPDKIQAIGNIKFDLNLPQEQIKAGQQVKSRTKRPIWIAASTHKSEEQHILAIHKSLLSMFPNLLLILVPRHQERFDEVATLAANQFQIQHRSTLAKFCQQTDIPTSLWDSPLFVAIHPETQVLIGDTIGEMFWYLSLADICFIGGSFVKAGGHNPIEPAAMGLPILTGPYTFNFKTVFKRCQKKQFCRQLNTPEELLVELKMLFNKPELRAQMATKAKDFVLQNQGVADKMLIEIAPYITKELTYDQQKHNSPTALYHRL